MLLVQMTIIWEVRDRQLMIWWGWGAEEIGEKRFDASSSGEKTLMALLQGKNYWP